MDPLRTPRLSARKLGGLVVGSRALAVGGPICGAHILLQGSALPDVSLRLRRRGTWVEHAHLSF